MNTLMITQCKNGYVLKLVDTNNKPLDTRIASTANTRGYGDDSLVNAIENIFKDNTPSIEKTKEVLGAWGLPTTLDVVDIPEVKEESGV